MLAALMSLLWILPGVQTGIPPAVMPVDELAPPVPPEIERKVREAVFGPEGDVGYTRKELASWRYPCRMPHFDGWIEDVFRFEAAGRELGRRFVAAKGPAELIEAGWTAGGFTLAPPAKAGESAGPGEPGGSGEAGEPGETAGGAGWDPLTLESLEKTLARLYETAGETAPSAELAGLDDRLPSRAARPLAKFLAALPACAEAWRLAVEEVYLDEEDPEAEDLETRALRYFSEGGDRPTLRLMEKQFNREQAGRAAVGFVSAVETLALDLRKARVDPRQGDVRFPTPYGTILLGARAKSEHAGEPMLLLVDVSGDDRYLSGTACGGGAQPLCAVIDLRGDDVYESRSGKGQAGAGAGVGGIGMVVDLDGDDQYLAGGYGAGFGALGAGVVHDLAGNDRYVGEDTCQGVGLCGVGLILDEKGDDHYELFYRGQGAGLPMGAGLLVDLEGDDTYTARDDELKRPSPQTREHNVSMAQGVGYGLRDDENRRYVSGGIGLLLDHAGDDEYRGAVFAQAVGYWYGLGLLFDLAGNDRYEAVYYGQSASAHFALSYLLDAGGDDSYKTSLSQSLGNGRDLSISVFRDREGNDAYFAPDRSLGCGDLDGTGLFIDEDGKDAYTFHTRVNGGLGIVREEIPEMRRTMATVGVFLDLGGDKDAYGREGLADGGQWTSGGQYEGIKGFGLDDGPGGR